jgi:hypothetical protein
MQSSSSPELEKREARNARARNNQRVSRARKLERIAHLEEQLRQYEQRGMAATLSVQTRAREVEAENRLMKGWLRSLAVSDADMAHWLSLSPEAGASQLKRHMTYRMPLPVPLIGQGRPASLPVQTPVDVCTSVTLPTMSTDLGSQTFDPTVPDAAFANFLNLVRPADPSPCGKGLSTVGQYFCNLLTTISPAIFSDENRGKHLTCRQTYDALQHVLGGKLSVEEVVGKLMASATLSTDAGEGSLVDEKVVKDILRDIGIESGGSCLERLSCCS